MRYSVQKSAGVQFLATLPYHHIIHQDCSKLLPQSKPHRILTGELLIGEPGVRDELHHAHVRSGAYIETPNPKPRTERPCKAGAVAARALADPLLARTVATKVCPKE